MNQGRHEKLLDEETPPMQVGEEITKLDDESLIYLRGRTLALYESICDEIEFREL